MKALLSLLTLLLICSCNQSYNSQNTSDLKNGGKLEADVSRINIGNVSKGNIRYVNFSFLVTNMSDSTIRIASIEPQCACVAINDYPKFIYPKEKQTISGRIDIKNQSGHINKAIFVTYNDSSLLLLRILGNVKK